jgi:hypothetical protein
LLKAEEAGNTVWSKIYDWSASHIAFNMSSSGNINDYGLIIAGYNSPQYNTEPYDVWAMQVDAQGNCQNIASFHDLTYSLVQPQVLNKGSGAFLLSAITYSSTVSGDLNLFIASGSFNPLVSVPVTGGPGSGNSYACPQPASDSIKFVYALKKPAEVTIYIYNFANKLAGKNVSTEAAGDNVSTEADIRKLPAGIYFYQITAKYTDGTSERLKPGKFMVKK